MRDTIQNDNIDANMSMGLGMGMTVEGSMGDVKRRRREPREMDIADRLIAHRRKTASTQRERARERAAASPSPASDPLTPLRNTPTPTSTPPPPILQSTPTPLRPPPPPPPLRRLFNPALDPIPSRPVPNPPAPAPPPPAPPPVRSLAAAAPQRTLFDPQRHDALRFSVLTRNANAHAHPPPAPPAYHPHPPPSSSTSNSNSNTLSSLSHTIQPTPPAAPAMFSGFSNSTTTTTTTTTTTNTHASTPPTSSYTQQPPSLSSLSNPNPDASRPSSLRSRAGIGNVIDGLKVMYREICQMEKRCEEAIRGAEAWVGESAAEVGRSGGHGMVGERRRAPWAGLVKSAGLQAEWEAERRWWLGMVHIHQELAEAHHALYKVALNPILPDSLDKLLSKYNLPSRLWQRIIHLLTTLVGRARTAPWGATRAHNADSPHFHPSQTRSFAQLHHFLDREPHELVQLLADIRYPPPPPALLASECLGKAVTWAYTFYGGLWEECHGGPQDNYKVAWAEAMGDLARFRMRWCEVEGAGAVKSVGGGGQQPQETASVEEDVDMDMEEGGQDEMERTGEGKQDGSVEEPDAADVADEDMMSVDESSSRARSVAPSPVAPLPALATHLAVVPRRVESPLPPSNLPASNRAAPPPTPAPFQQPQHSQLQLLQLQQLLSSQQPPQQQQQLPPQQAMIYYPASVGMQATLSWPPISEPDTWRRVAQEWYWRGLAEMPGTGRLQHHLGLLAADMPVVGAGVVGAEREREKEKVESSAGGGVSGWAECRVAYHFLKSLTTSQPHLTARESVLPLFNADRQRARGAPGATTSALFVLMHGMLYTRVQLDDFEGVRARFEERLGIELADGLGGGSEGEWIMWAVMCLAGCAEYGKEEGVIRRAEGRTRKQGGEEERREEPDEEMEDVTEGISALHADAGAATATAAEQEEHPLPFRLALQLTFSILAIVLRHPYRKSPPYFIPHLNPFITIMLTYLCTVAKSRKALDIIERHVPWEALAAFVRTHVARTGEKDRAERLLAGGILPEDWALRGMDWVTRRVYTKGFWDKRGRREIVGGEMEVLSLGAPVAYFGGSVEVPRDRFELVTDGLVEDEGESLRDAWEGLAKKRWKRVMGAAARLGKLVRGWEWEDGRGWVVRAPLGDKIAAWREEGERERREEEERRARRRGWGADGDVEMEMDVEEEMEEDDEDEDASPLVRELKARREYLRDVVTRRRSPARHAQRAPARQRPRSLPPAKADVQVLRGYTILVVDTNVLLSYLPQFQALIESMRWTVVVPLPVIAELQGLSSSDTVSSAASQAVKYITSHVRTHARSLKVQTSKGNYLVDLTCSTEDFDFQANNGEARNMDGLILDAAAWQAQHFVDRSALLGDEEGDKGEATCRVLLLTLDRILRLRARARKIDVASPAEIVWLLGSAL